jgi:integrase
MPANDNAYSVQRFRGGFALVYRGADGKRVRRTLTAEDRTSAEAEARSLWIGGERGAWTVGRVMLSYLASIDAKVSHQRRVDAWKAMAPFWQDVDPALIDEPMARAYAERRRAADSTVRYELLQLSTALGWATTNGPKINMRPKVWLPPVPDRKTRHLTRDEFRRFFAAVKADHARLYVMVGLYTMARPTAILELEWNRVDFARRLIDFTPPGHVRTAKRRTIVPIADELLTALQTGHATRTTEWVIERGGQPVACIKKAFQAASERSAVHATPYTLRHTGAVWAAEAGVPMAELSQFMGHDDDRTTQKHYSRFSPGYLMGVANSIGAVA